MYFESVVKYLRETIGEPRIGAEVGVWAGVTTTALLRAFPTLLLHAVDPWEDGDPENTTNRQQQFWLDSRPGTTDTVYRSTRDILQKVSKEFYIETAWAKDRIIVHRMKSLDAAKSVVEGELDFVFIDGDHRYQSVKDDLNAWWPKLRNGGVLIGHDYRKSKYPSESIGVIQATNEFVAKHGFELQIIGRATYALRKPEYLK